MNAHMNETLNIGGALLVKLFGRANEEEKRFRERAASVRDIGIRRAVVGSTFFVIFGLVSAVGTALVYGLGGYYVITGCLHGRHHRGVRFVSRSTLRRAARSRGRAG